MISDAEMSHLLNLARLELPEGETERMKRDLSAILGYVEQLNALDTEGAEPLARPVALESVFRDDLVLPPLPQRAALALGVETEGDFFRVPRTVDTDG